ATRPTATDLVRSATGRRRGDGASPACAPRGYGWWGRPAPGSGLPPAARRAMTSAALSTPATVRRTCSNGSSSRIQQPRKRAALPRPDAVQHERRRAHVQQDALQRRGPLGDLPDPEADLVPLALVLLTMARTLPVVELEVTSDGAQAVDRALQIEPQVLGARRLRNRPGSPP